MLVAERHMDSLHGISFPFVLFLPIYHGDALKHLAFVQGHLGAFNCDRHNEFGAMVMIVSLSILRNVLTSVYAS